MPQPFGQADPLRAAPSAGGLPQTFGVTSNPMSDDVITYDEMCRREQPRLQRGMSFRIGKNHSVVLMSVLPNAPYRDRIEDSGTTLVYEGHDLRRSKSGPNPKEVDQPLRYPNGAKTPNGRFHEAAQDAKAGRRLPERVRVYEKLCSGVWSYNGVFHLVDSWIENDKIRAVLKFKLLAVEGEEDFEQPVRPTAELRRLIPTQVKIVVWKRDGGKCSACGRSDELHFHRTNSRSRDSALPDATDVRLLCARHNPAKSDGVK